LAVFLLGQKLLAMFLPGQKPLAVFLLGQKLLAVSLLGQKLPAAVLLCSSLILFLPSLSASELLLTTTDKTIHQRTSLPGSVAAPGL
jgi:hypothetical protein